MNMRINHVKEKLNRGEACRGIWLAIPSIYSARLLASQPSDFLVIDTEHAPVGIEKLAQMTAVIADSNGPAPLVRLSQASSENIKQALDAGAYGIIAPMINTREEADQVVRWTKFPPEGQRSYGSPYPGLAFDVSGSEYLNLANQQILTAIQIESQAALNNLDETFAAPGLDLVFIGPIDLSISLGLEPLPENTHPIFLEALEEIKQAALTHHLPMGIYCTNGKAAAQRIEEGFLLVNVATDVNLLKNGFLDELSDST